MQGSGQPISPVRQIAVPFHGFNSATEELTWGQRAIWGPMAKRRSSLPIPTIRELPTGVTVADLVGELRYCLHRFESMRTRLSFDGSGEPRQVVAGEGELTLDLFEAADADPDDLAARVRDMYLDRDFDWAEDMPVHTGVVLRHGMPSRVVSVYSHLVLDGAALFALRDELHQRLLTGRDVARAPAMQPVELARWERSEAGQRASTASLRHWEALVRAVPAARFAGAGDPQQPRYWEASFTSRALHLALPLIARRTGGGTAGLLAVLAVALARVTGDSPMVAHVVVSNRFRPQLANVFAPVNQPGLWAADVADVTFAELLRQARRRAMGTYKNAYYDLRQMEAVAAKLTAELGESLAFDWFFNDRRRVTTVEPDGGDPTLPEVRAAQAETTFRWRTRTDSDPFVAPEPLTTGVDEFPGVIQITISIDTHVLGPGRIEAMAQEVDAVALTAAFDPAAPTGVGPGRRPGVRGLLGSSSSTS